MILRRNPQPIRDQPTQKGIRRDDAELLCCQEYHPPGVSLGANPSVHQPARD
jgi:hypothetical protein